MDAIFCPFCGEKNPEIKNCCNEYYYVCKCGKKFKVIYDDSVYNNRFEKEAIDKQLNNHYRKSTYTPMANISNKNIITAGNGLYSTCSKCGKIVKLNKFLFGSLHICDD